MKKNYVVIISRQLGLDYNLTPDEVKLQSLPWGIPADMQIGYGIDGSTEHNRIGWGTAQFAKRSFRLLIGSESDQYVTIDLPSVSSNILASTKFMSALFPDI